MLFLRQSFWTPVPRGVLGHFDDLIFSVPFKDHGSSCQAHLAAEEMQS